MINTIDVFLLLFCASPVYRHELMAIDKEAEENNYDN